jgi:hypothetical protein
MARLSVVAALAILAMAAGSSAQTPELTPEQAEKARELAMKGHALFLLLKEPIRCGAPAPKGYACALVLYKDISEEKDRDRLPELLTARVTGMTEADGPPAGAKVRVLSPFDASPRTMSPLDMTRVRLSLIGNNRGAEIATLEMQGVLGYAENEALPASDKRKLDRNRFKLPR